MSRSSMIEDARDVAERVRPRSRSRAAGTSILEERPVIQIIFKQNSWTRETITRHESFTSVG